MIKTILLISLLATSIVSAAPVDCTLLDKTLCTSNNSVCSWTTDATKNTCTQATDCTLVKNTTDCANATINPYCNV